MADIVKLKKKASDLEAKKQGEKALAVYVEIVEAYEGWWMRPFWSSKRPCGAPRGALGRLKHWAIASSRSSSSPWL